MSDDLQLHRRLSPRDQDHPGDPRGQRGDRGAPGLSGPERPGRADGTLFGDVGDVGDIGGTATADGPADRPDGRRAFIIRTDGAARGNPGPASAGAALYDAARPDARDPAATPDASISDYLGIQTNNVAEYTGTLRALELARELGATEVHLLLDSKLIVEQLSGRWRVKDAKLIPMWAAARTILAAFERWTAGHVPRAQNHAADALANEAIDRAHAGGPASVVRRPAPRG